MVSQPKVSQQSEAQADAESLARGAWLAMYRLLRSDESVQAGAEAAEAEGLTPQQFAALLSLPLDLDRGVAMRDLATTCHSTPSYMTAVVDALEERDLVARHPDRDDRRVTQVRLTSHGMAAVGRAHMRLSVPPSGLRALPTEDLRILRDLLERAAEPYPWP